MTIRVGVTGAAGRMGRAIIELLAEADDLAFCAAIEQPGSDFIGADAGETANVGKLDVAITDTLSTELDRLDVLIDFSHPSSAPENARQCAAAGRRVVIGTTGLSETERGGVISAGEESAIVLAPNMSIGVNLCFKLAEVAARALGDDVDIEIIEAHHKHKIDAPSGTALRMGEIVADTLGRELKECAVYGRSGRDGQRGAKTIGFETIRAGDIVGDHTVMFAGSGERIEIVHRATSRSTFATGALRSARWVMGKGPGVYDMQDVLGLRD